MSQGPIEIECSQCGAFYRIPAERIPVGGASATCKKCGNSIVVMPPNSQTSVASRGDGFIDKRGRDEAKPLSEPAHERRPIGDSGQNDSVTAQDLKLFVGEKYGNYYGPKFDRFSRGDGVISWNWPAFFFPAWWFLYRKIYGWAVLALLLNQIPLLNWLIGVGWGMSANHLYYKKARGKIGEIRRSEGAGGLERAAGRIREAGGVNGGVVAYLAVGFFGIAFIGILAAIAIPQFSAYRTRAYNAQAQSALSEATGAQEAYFRERKTYSRSMEDLKKISGQIATPTGVKIEVVSAGKWSYEMVAFHESGNKKYALKGPGGAIVELRKESNEKPRNAENDSTAKAELFAKEQLESLDYPVDRVQLISGVEISKGHHVVIFEAQIKGNKAYYLLAPEARAYVLYDKAEEVARFERILSKRAEIQKEMICEAFKELAGVEFPRGG